MRQELNEEIKQISLRIVRSFHEYFTAIFYHALPASILYYPRQLVVGCDLNLFQSHLAAAREKNKNKDKSKGKDKDKCELHVRVRSVEPWIRDRGFPYVLHFHGLIIWTW